MVDLYNISRQTMSGRRGLDFEREKQEFEARKRQREMELQLQEQLGPLELQRAQFDLRKAERDLARGVSSNDPAAVREWNFYSQLTPEEQQRYLSMKRSDQVLNLGGQMAVRSPLGGIQEAYTVTPKITETPGYMAAQSGATEAAKQQQQLQYQPILQAEKMRAQSQAEAEIGLGQLEQNAGLMLETIDKLADEQGNLRPGVGQAVGGVGGMQGLQSSVLPVTESQRRVQPILDQIKGQTFLEAYERLKGGGVITEIEGAKAEQALARLDQRQSDADFAAALQDLREVVNSGLERARQKAGATQRRRITLDEFLRE